jgi:hypothetical protein
MHVISEGQVEHVSCPAGRVPNLFKIMLRSGLWHAAMRAHFYRVVVNKLRARYFLKPMQLSLDIPKAMIVIW